MTGLLVIQGACEAFIHGVERLGARYRWDGFIPDTVGSVLSTLPEFVVSEYIIVYKSHRRGELGIALSNVFGGLTQVFFLLLPFGLIVIGISGLATRDAKFAFPVSVVAIMLILLLFPLFYALHQHIEQDRTLSNLDAAGMTGIYVLLLNFLFIAPA